MKLSSFLLTVEAETLRSYARRLAIAGIDLKRISTILDAASAFEMTAQELKEAGR